MRRLNSFTAAVVAALLLACGPKAGPPQSFVASLRCGMTRQEVARLARLHRYDPADAGWLTRATSRTPPRSKELLDLTFREGRLVAVRQGVYTPLRRRIEYRTVDLCASR